MRSTTLGYGWCVVPMSLILLPRWRWGESCTSRLRGCSNSRGRSRDLNRNRRWIIRVRSVRGTNLSLCWYRKLVLRLYWSNSPRRRVFGRGRYRIIGAVRSYWRDHRRNFRLHGVCVRRVRVCRLCTCSHRSTDTWHCRSRFRWASNGTGSFDDSLSRKSEVEAGGPVPQRFPQRPSPRASRRRCW